MTPSSYPDARIDTPSEAETLRDLDALAWSSDLEDPNEDDEEAPLFVAGDTWDRGRRT